jgi:hypothetical protein
VITNCLLRESAERPQGTAEVIRSKEREQVELFSVDNGATVSQAVRGFQNLKSHELSDEFLGPTLRRCAISQLRNISNGVLWVLDLPRTQKEMPRSFP